MPTKGWVFATIAAILAAAAFAAPTESVIYSFSDYSDGSGPRGALIFDTNGNIYGTTFGGGTGSCEAGCGTVFELTLSNGVWTKNTIYNFMGGNDGSFPWSGVTADASGNLYGTTNSGGTCCGGGYGTVYELTPSDSGWAETVLYRFLNGSYPYGGVVIDRKGDLYGTTYGGGSHSDGTVFRLDHTKNGWAEDVLYNFCSLSGCSDGAAPQDGLTADDHGNLYGTTYAGGAYPNGYGTVFELSRQNGAGNWKESVLYAFQSRSDGKNPESGVTFDKQGNLYGTTFEGGASENGTVFELTPSGKTWTHTAILQFSGGNDGGVPMSRVTIDGNGDLYGTTYIGGTHERGTVYKLILTNNGWREVVLYDFCSVQGCSDGFEPAGPVTLNSGVVYGTTLDGGTGACMYGCGTVFQLAR